MDITDINEYYNNIIEDLSDAIQKYGAIMYQKGLQDGCGATNAPEK